jgi:hypothetical protein
MDKYYTKPEVAQKCLDAVGQRFDWSQWGLVIEPSAGSGSFFHRIPVTNKVGLDIAPEAADIQTQDFLTYRPLLSQLPLPQSILVIGNPPFGRVSSMAIRFFQHAAVWASVIAFIVPRTFRRISVQNKLDRRFHLIHDADIPLKPCAFEPPMMAKCCFQIWQRRDEQRQTVELPTSHPDWTFLPLGPLDEKGQPTPPAGADFAIRAYGGACGEIRREGLATLRPKSWHWIAVNSTAITAEELMARFVALDYSVSLDTARQNSLGRAELVALYSNATAEQR